MEKIVSLPPSQWVCMVQKAGDPSFLTYQQYPLPIPDAGEVLIRIAATGVNFIETYQRSGVYPVKYPFIPGAECSGTVVAVGSDVEDFSVGDRVMTYAAVGAYAQYAAVLKEHVFEVPASFDLVEAAALPLQGLTAHYLARSSYQIQPGDTVLIHAGAGGVGLILTQIAKILGATVITTASTPEKRERSRQAGADHVLGYEDFAHQVRSLTNGVGVDAVYDGVGKDTYLDSIASVRPRGHVVIFGGASGQVPPLDIQELNRAGSVYLSRPTLTDFTADEGERKWRAEELTRWIGDERLTLSIGATYPLSDAKYAHEALESRKTIAKLLLIPPGE